MRWWQSFGDPVLDSLVEQALKDNLDIRIAAARVERFLGQLSTTRSQFSPRSGTVWMSVVTVRASVV